MAFETSGIVGYSEKLLPSHRALIVDLFSFNSKLEKKLKSFYSADGWEKSLRNWEKTRNDIEQKYGFFACRFFYVMKEKKLIGFSNSLESISKIFREHGIKSNEIFVMGLTYEEYNEFIMQMT